MGTEEERDAIIDFEAIFNDPENMAYLIHRLQAAEKRVEELEQQNAALMKLVPPVPPFPIDFTGRGEGQAGSGHSFNAERKAPRC